MEWVRVDDRLPPILETFNDGTSYHGEVEGWFPKFYKNKRRPTALWTHPDTGPRWMGNQGNAFVPIDAPTHWLIIEPPEENQ